MEQIRNDNFVLSCLLVDDGDDVFVTMATVWDSREFLFVGCSTVEPVNNDHLYNAIDCLLSI